jgi:flagella basal body P-ring formation protein FlgA
MMSFLRRLAPGLVLAWLACGGGGAASAAEQRTIPVPRATVYPGDAITPELLVERAFPAAFLKSRVAVESADALIGKIAKRTLLPGYPIEPNTVTEPDVVSKSVPVQVVFQSGGLTITTVAAPLQNGRVGDAVSARNVDSGITIRGVVQADGTIRVGPM